MLKNSYNIIDKSLTNFCESEKISHSSNSSKVDNELRTSNVLLFQNNTILHILGEELESSDELRRDPIKNSSSSPPL